MPTPLFEMPAVAAATDAEAGPQPQVESLWHSLLPGLPDCGVPQEAMGATSVNPEEAAGSPASTATLPADANEESRAAGYAAGYAAGSQLAHTELAGQKLRLHASIAQFEDLWEQQVRCSQNDLARLSLMVAEQILLAELPARRDYTARMARHSIDLLVGASQLRIRLSPDDAVHLRDTRPDLWSRPGLVWLEDPNLQLGGLVAECVTGRVDASIAERLRAMAQTLGVPAETAAL